MRDLPERFRFKKSLGQNLLLDKNINRKMVELAEIESGDSVLEIGGGMGDLTEAIVAKKCSVLSIEIDHALAPILESRFADNDDVEVTLGDFLNQPVESWLARLYDCDETEVISQNPRPVIMSNLPYYAAMAMIKVVLESDIPAKKIVVMVQKEVGERMTSTVGSKQYGLLALSVSLFAHARLAWNVPSTVFKPRPRVDSAIVVLEPFEKVALYGDDRRFFFTLIKTAFRQRRKMLRNSLTKSPEFGAAADAVIKAFEETGIDGKRRPETLTLDELIELSRTIRSLVP